MTPDTFSRIFAPEEKGLLKFLCSAHLDGYIARRRELARRCDRLLAESSLLLPRSAENNGHVYYVYVVRHPNRDRIVTELSRRGIFVNVSYRWPIHVMRGYAHLGYAEGSFPNAEAASREIFSLPMYPTLREDEQDDVCRALGEILGERLGPA